LKEYLSSVGARGQITLPLEVRRRLGLKPKDRVAIVVEDKTALVKSASSDLGSGFQSIPALGRNLTVEEMTEIAGEENAAEAVREGL
jgi:AbrB family looped-hinge helix DNA binding protein